MAGGCEGLVGLGAGLPESPERRASPDGVAG